MGLRNYESRTFPLLDWSFPNYIIIGGKELEITIYQIIPELDKEHVKFRELAYLLPTLKFMRQSITEK